MLDKDILQKWHLLNQRLEGEVFERHLELICVHACSSPDSRDNMPHLATNTEWPKLSQEIQSHLCLLVDRLGILPSVYNVVLHHFHC